MSYSYEDAFKETKKYFDDEELPSSTFLDKYALKDLNSNLLEQIPDSMHIRIAKEIFRTEQKKFKKPYSFDFIYSYLKNFGKIIPQGSPMYGIGNQYQYSTLSNCYVVNTPQDSYSGIMYTDNQLTQIYKRRGGCGLDLSLLRPSGTATTNASRSSTGIISFMERFSNTTREVCQDGRRGALMITLSVHHPEILDFCKIKLDKNKVTGANISVRLTNEFLNAVKENKEYEQRWPVDSDKPIILKKVKARNVWKEIIRCAWLRAEPGLLFWDNIIEESPADCYGEEGFSSVSTNPCVPSWTSILTKDGLKQLKEIKNGDEIWSKDGWTKVLDIWFNGIKKVYKYTTSVGIFYGTEEHKIVSEETKIKVLEAESIDKLVGKFDSEIEINIQDIMDGLVIGDGTVHKASNNLVLLLIGQDDQDYFNSEIQNLIIKKRNGITDESYEITTSIKYSELDLTFNRKIPKRFIYGNKNKICGFLRGLYSANGSICGQRITLKTSSKNIRDEVQLMLSSVGISSYYTTNKPTKVKFSNGEYLCKESYDVNITTDRDKFVKIIGFIQEYKNDKAQYLLNNVSISNKSKRSYEIKSVELYSEEEVFDIKVDNKSETFWNNGLDVSNCSEIPLCILDSCRLLVVNLFKHVVNPFLSSAYFDYEEFYKTCMVAQRFMDDIIDLEIECVNKIIKKVKSDPEPDNIKQIELDLWKTVLLKCKQGRRTGVGPTALADTMAALGIKYGSKESLEFVDEVYKTMKFGCYSSSIEMAKELGPFEIWDYEKEKKNPFLKRIEKEHICIGEYASGKSLFVNGKDLYEQMKKHGRRNIACLTTAPTGSTSLLTEIEHPIHGTSSGIEPAFMLSYKRRKKINPGDKNARVDFVDEVGDSWQEFIVYHPAVKLWMKVTGETDITKSPWYGCCAENLNWKKRVELQSIAQKHIDHAISSTINLPSDVTEEQVAQIYEEAWEKGCKGITVYRNGCRDGVLVENKKVDALVLTDAPKRPKELPCDIHFTTKKGKEYFVLVGLLNGKPYEIFAGIYPEMSKYYEKGILKKISRGRYTLLGHDGKLICENVADYLEDDEEALTRLSSTSLRHGTPIDFLTHQLDKTKGDITNFAKSMARILKKYIKDGTKVSGEQCPKCESVNLRRQEGCVTCECGWSKCG